MKRKKKTRYFIVPVILLVLCAVVWATDVKDQMRFNAKSVPQVTVTNGDALGDDSYILYDGNAQDYYTGIDDSADTFIIGYGSAMGTTPAISIDSSQIVTFSADPVISGTTPRLTIGDAGAEDTDIVFAGNTLNFHAGIDDSADSFEIGVGSTFETFERLTITGTGNDTVITLHDATANDALIIFDGNAQDFHVGLDDTADDLVIGVGSALGTTTAISIDENAAVLIRKVLTEVTTAANVITAAECGTTYFLDDAAGVGYASTLPAPSAGCYFKFIVHTAVGTTDYTVTTNGGSNIIEGLVDENSTIVACASQDTLEFDNAADTKGDWVEVLSDGTSWYVSGATAAGSSFTCSAS